MAKYIKFYFKNKIYLHLAVWNFLQILIHSLKACRTVGNSSTESTNFYNKISFLVVLHLSKKILCYNNTANNAPMVESGTKKKIMSVKLHSEHDQFPKCNLPNKHFLSSISIFQIFEYRMSLSMVPFIKALLVISVKLPKFPFLVKLAAQILHG